MSDNNLRLSGILSYIGPWGDATCITRSSVTDEDRAAFDAFLEGKRVSLRGSLARYEEGTERELQRLDVEIAEFAALHDPAIACLPGPLTFGGWQVFQCRNSDRFTWILTYDRLRDLYMTQCYWDGRDAEAERDARFHRDSRRLTCIGVCALLALIAFEALAVHFHLQGVF